MEADIVSIKDILNTVIDSLHIENGAETYDFFSSWPEVVGDKIASHTKVADIRDGVLYLIVDHPGWMQTIQMNRKKILSDIEKRYKNLGIRSISLKVNATNT